MEIVARGGDDDGRGMMRTMVARQWRQVRVGQAGGVK